MDSFWVVIVVMLGVGAVGGIQGPLNTMLSSRVGILEGSFLVHLVGAIAGGIPLLLMTGGGLSRWQSVPWYVWIGGALGILVIMAFNYSIPRIGIAQASVLFIVAQLTVNTIIGHFGWLELPVRPIDLGKMVGMVLLLLGAWLVVRPS